MEGRMMRLFGGLALACVIAFAGEAHAANGFAVSWLQLQLSNASNPCAVSRPCLYWSSVDGKIHVVDASGNDIAPGAGGGGSNLRLTYAAGASSADSIMTLDSTRAAIQIADPASPLNGTLFSVVNSSSQAFFSVTDNSTLTLKSGGSSGGTAVAVDTFSSWTGGTLLKVASGGTNRFVVQPFGAALSPIAVGGAPTMLTLTGAASTGNTASTEVPDVDVNLARSVNWSTGALATQRFFRIRQPTITFIGASNITGNAATLSLAGPPLAGTNATYTGSAWTLWLETGNLGFGPNAAIGQSSQSTSGTTALSLNPNVADGASSVGLLVNAGTTQANATASLFSLANNGTRLLNTRINSSDGFTLVDGGGVAKLALSTNVGAVFGYSSATFSAGSGSVTMTDGTGSIGMLAGNLTLTILQGVADADGTRDWGTLATRWRIGGFKRLISGTQSLSFSATPAFDCTAGNTIHIGAITGNITGPTMVAGSAGEQCTIIFLKDGTAGAYTITASWGSNVRTTASTFTTGAGSLVILHFIWDDRLSTPAWVETSGLAFN